MTGGIVVVLGKTGRNFAAGMSGGIAFILNEDGKFESRCNMGMVELEKVMAADDKLILWEMVTAHFTYTGSRKAKLVLDAWEVFLPKFLKIMPIDYKRVLAERKAAAAKEQATKEHKEMVAHG
jgi:glutamate synthase (NADPH/NADH) large chain/glutamate synthase (ferredoxin)